MYQSDVKPTNLLHLSSAPQPVTAAMSPESSSTSSTAAYMITTSSAAGPGPNLHFPSPLSTDYLQLRGVSDTWQAPPQTPVQPPTSQHHHQHDAWESLPTTTYFSQPHQSPSYTKPRRSQMPPMGCKRSGSGTITAASGKAGFRGLRDEREESCRVINGSNSPRDLGGSLEGMNGSAVTVAAATKKCRVCGDRAVNHNFGQLTCESCKAFFRRNAHKDLTCTSKSGEHVVSPSTRRECPACRLKRCFLIGMRPDLIQVRKKDGTKPRWLDKYPAAAQVHEHHVGRSEVSKMSRLKQNPSPGDSSHRDPYALTYSLYTEAPHQLGGGQLMKGVRSFETYPPEAPYIAPQSVVASRPLPPTPVLQNNGGMYEENGRGISAVLGGEVDPALSEFQIKTELSSPQYRIPDCVVLTNPLADENARQKSSTWNQSIVNNFTLPISNSNWLQPHSSYHTSQFQNGGIVLLDSFNSEHSLLSNLQFQERPAFASLDPYTSLPPTGSRSGASSGSTASPSVAFSVPNFGSCCTEPTQGNFDSSVLKPATSEWIPKPESEARGVYLQDFSPFKNKVLSSGTTNLRQPLLSSVEGDQWFNRLTKAWRTAWRDGVFPNPSQVRLPLDLTESTEDWRLTLANLWSDLLLRRVADFASGLFHTLHPKSSTDFRLSSALLGWIFKNRLVNCVPIILANALLQSSELNATSSSPAPQSQNQQNELDDGGSSPRSPRDCEASSGGTSYASPRVNGGGRAATPTWSVSFQVAPQHRVFINLSQLNAKLAENHTTASYPMLQYLDAYVCELNKFLTGQTLLLGAYMAIKLTEPPTPGELIQNPPSDADVQLINSLNVKFLHLFGMAADHVASSIVNGELCDSLQTQAKAMNDAICRRTKLPDFLSWSRQFDENIKSLLYDVWNISRHQPQAFISPGLAALCSDSNPSPLKLLHLLSGPTSDEALDVG
uniref:Nuclear hormone receptor HR96 n=1 Tax=Echinococcus granulosus TaxID=6210 RepID=A0A068WK51_ECHGR|nr:Nuclear hormone receptor HR96 [Echinococcus granulosus]